VQTGSNYLGQVPVVGCYEHINEPLGSVKGGEFFDQLNDC
jgi:hypothetical protein